MLLGFAKQDIRCQLRRLLEITSANRPDGESSKASDIALVQLR